MVLVLVGVFAMAKLVNDPTSVAGRILGVLTLAALVPLMAFIAEALMSHVEGASHG